MNEYERIALELSVAEYGYRKLELQRAMGTKDENKKRNELSKSMTAIVQCVNRMIEDAKASNK